MADIEVKKIAYWYPVDVAEGVPRCPCCREPMVKRPGGWMCALGAAALDALKPVAAALDAALGIAPDPRATPREDS